MIGWLIFLTEGWIPGELGVRMMPILMNATALFFLYKSTDQKNPLLLFILIFSMFEAHVGGFIAAPDAPLVFFSTLFIYLLKLYLEKDTYGLAGLMGLVAACIFYSKYQGLMFLFFLFLPNFKLMGRRSFWLMAFVALIASLPLLNYLLVVEFDTIFYHLETRSTEHWNWNFIWNHLGGQLGVVGPLMAFILFPASFLIKNEEPFLRGLKFCFWGIQAFLLFLATRTWVEANWAATSLAPMVILTYQFISDKVNWQKWVYRLAVPSLVLMVVFRVYLLVDFLPNLTQKRNEMHGWDTYMQNIADKAGDSPAVFFNSFGDPAKYMFYTGKQGHSIHNFAYHSSTFSVAPIEEKLLGKTIYLLSNWSSPMLPDSFPTPYGKTKYGGFIDDFYTYRDIRIVTDQKAYEVKKGEPLKLRIQMINGYDQKITFDENPERPVDLWANFNDDGKWKYRSKVRKELWKGELEDSLEKEIVFDVPAQMKPGKYWLRLSFQCGWIPASINGGLVEFRILGEKK